MYTELQNKTHKHKNKRHKNKTHKNKTHKINDKRSTSIRNKQFLYNPNNPTKSFDVYIDKNPSDTIHIKYTTVEDVKNTIKKLEYLYKSNRYSHKRIWQVGMIMKVRLEAIYKKRNTKYKNSKEITKRFKLSEKYFNFLSKRSKMNEKERKQFTFSY